jgi:hypothetical protein
MGETNQVVAAIVTGICCTGVFGGAIKYMLDQLRSVRAELKAAVEATQRSLDQLDDDKIDKEMCVLQHRQIIQDLEDGREKFRDLLTKNTALASDVTRMATQLALILQRLELSLPRIERAAGMLPSITCDDGR